MCLESSRLLRTEMGVRATLQWVVCVQRLDGKVASIYTVQVLMDANLVFVSVPGSDDTYSCPSASKPK